MIKPGFIEKQICKSRKSGRTSRFLRQLIFSVVDKSLRKRYAENYPIKCLQSSVGIKSLLELMDINSTIFTGATCFAEVYEQDDSIVGWSGFWDRDHHVWLVTEHNELVDLTISELHLHPASSRPDAVPVPALWWDDLDRWPKIIRYLPESPVKIELPKEEMKDLDDFKNDVMKEMQIILDEMAVTNISFPTILEGVDSIQQLTTDGNLWLQKCLKVQDLNIPLPEWIRNRENELIEKYSDARW